MKGRIGPESIDAGASWPGHLSYRKTRTHERKKKKKKEEGISEGEWPGKQKWRLRRWSGEGNRSGRGRRAVWRRGWTSILPPCISSSLFPWPFLWWVFFSFKPKTISRFGGFGEVSERARYSYPIYYWRRDSPPRWLWLVEWDTKLTIQNGFHLTLRIKKFE